MLDSSTSVKRRLIERADPNPCGGLDSPVPIGSTRPFFGAIRANYDEDSATPAINRVLLLDRGDWVPYYRDQAVKFNVMAYGVDIRSKMQSTVLSASSTENLVGLAVPFSPRQSLSV